jgi:Fe-S-cluster containining protein
MHECQYCGKLCKQLGWFSHERLCIKNPNKKKEDHPSFGKIGRNNQYTKAKKLNIEYVPSAKELEGRKRTGNKTRERNLIKWKNPDARKEQSNKIKAAILRHPERYSASSVSGRCKIYDYNGTKLKGSWELLFAKWLDLVSIKWTNNVTGFSYEWNGNRTYFPDFYLPEYDVYIEIKGYSRESDRDLAKWKAVKNLKILKYSEIKRISNDEFTIIDLMAM